MAEFQKHLRTIVGVAAVVLLADFVTKELALLTLGDASTAEAKGILGFSFALALNYGAAGGVSLGDNTRLINIASMFSIVLLSSLVWKQLSAMHRLAPIAFGLITGAALGNTLSLLLGPAVVDFIAYSGSTGAVVFNVADIAVVAGIGCLVPPAFSVAACIRDGYADIVKPLAKPSRRAPQIAFDREVPIVFASEVSLEPEIRHRTPLTDTVQPDPFMQDRRWNLDDRRQEPRA